MNLTKATRDRIASRVRRGAGRQAPGASEVSASDPFKRFETKVGRADEKRESHATRTGRDYHSGVDNDSD